MKTTIRCVSVALVAWALSTIAPTTLLADAGQLQGAWKLTRVSFASPDTSYVWEAPQPGLFIFGKKHYSIMYAIGTEPRALFADDSEQTDDELLAAYRSFIANSGTYEVKGNTLKTRPLVAKDPNFMATGWVLHEYTVKGQVLELSVKSWSGVEGDVQYKSTFTLMRVE